MKRTLGLFAYLWIFCVPMGLAQVSTDGLKPNVNSSQPTDMTMMNHSTSIIDGSDNPDQIPDAVAYRLYFTTVGESPNPTDDRQRRQRAYLSKIQGLSVADAAALSSILETFKVNFDAMVKKYNAAVTNASHAESPQPDAQAFLESRDLLVQQTRDQLKAVLSPSGMAGLDAHVKFEKRRMRISAPLSQEVDQ